MSPHPIGFNVEVQIAYDEWMARHNRSHEERQLNDRDLLEWLAQSNYSQYGECYGASLDRLIGQGLARIHEPGEHQGSFIAQDNAGKRGIMYCAVSLTDKGRARLKELS